MSLELETTKRQFEEERNLTKRLQGEVAEARQASDDLADEVLAMKEDMIRTNDEIKSMTKVIIIISLWGQAFMRENLSTKDMLGPAILLEVQKVLTVLKY